MRRGEAHDFLGFPKWAKLKNSPRAFSLKRRVHKERIPRLKGLKKAEGVRGGGLPRGFKGKRERWEGKRGKNREKREKLSKTL